MSEAPSPPEVGEGWSLSLLRTVCQNGQGWAVEKLPTGLGELEWFFAYAIVELDLGCNFLKMNL